MNTNKNPAQYGWIIYCALPKEEALNSIAPLLEDSDMADIIYRLYVLDKIRKGQETVEQGRTLTREELKLDIDTC